jgi:hypothetical protein
MATWDDVARIALTLPETAAGTSYGNRAWKVKDKAFVWERPLRRADHEHFGDAAPDGPILAARVEHEGAKRALIATRPDVYFTTPHFDGHPSILVRLDAIDPEELVEVVVEAWLNRAPARVAAAAPAPAALRAAARGRAAP